MYNILSTCYLSPRARYYMKFLPSFQLPNSETTSISGWNEHYAYPSGGKLTRRGSFHLALHSRTFPPSERAAIRRVSVQISPRTKRLKFSSGIHKWRLGALETLAEFPRRGKFWTASFARIREFRVGAPVRCSDFAARLPNFTLRCLRSTALCHNVRSRAANSTSWCVFHVRTRAVAKKVWQDLLRDVFVC